jgi:hypothetical protein
MQQTDRTDSAKKLPVERVLVIWQPARVRYVNHGFVRVKSSKD